MAVEQSGLLVCITEKVISHKHGFWEGVWIGISHQLAHQRRTLDATNEMG